MQKLQKSIWLAIVNWNVDTDNLPYIIFPFIQKAKTHFREAGELCAWKATCCTADWLEVASFTAMLEYVNSELVNKFNKTAHYSCGQYNSNNWVVSVRQTVFQAYT